VDVEKTETVAIQSSDDVVRVRRDVRALAISAGFSLVDQTKIVTAASEIARNTIDYGGGGHAQLQVVRHGNRKGVRMIFEDKGPGIPDIELAITEGYTTGKGLGLGLSGARRLSNEFDLKSKPGEGTTVTLVRWK
jgi:serine/threonine-protein kinase RsbT